MADITTNGTFDRAATERKARRSILIMVLVAAVILSVIGGVNLYVDAAGILRDQTTTHNVRNYIESLRSAEVGVPYTYYDRPIKLALARTSTADCLVTGSSHTMTLRVNNNAVIGAECRALDNAGLSGASFEDLITIMGAALANPNVKHVYIGFDIWSFRRNTAERWRRTTPAFLAARDAFGLPAGVYDARGSATPEQTLREVFSFSYLKLNYKQIRRVLRGKATLLYSAKQLDEHDLKKQLALRADGSLSYPEEFKPTPGDAELDIIDQWIEPPYYEADALAEMRQAVGVLQQAGKVVTFFIGPYHPVVFNCSKPRICEGIHVMDPIIRNLAADLKIQVIGGFDPSSFGLPREAFIDFQHLRGSELHRLRILSPEEVARDEERFAQFKQ